MPRHPAPPPAFAAALVAICLLLITTPAMAAQVIAGTVARVQGTAMASSGGLSRRLAADSAVFVGDVIATGEGSRLLIRLGEGTTITLGDRSSITIEQPETEQLGGLVDVLRGVFVATTRAIADLGRNSLTVKTPGAVLGVRGTTVWGEQGAGRLGVSMLAGKQVVVTTAYGTVVLDQVNDGTDVIAGEPPTPVKTWGENRLQAARAKVAFE